jgi:RimJ/RimL family protein N-acetyltransferase
MSEVTVRRATPSDFDEWFALFELVAGEGMWIGAELPIDRDHFRKNFDEFLADKRKARFIAEVDGVLVGELGVGKEVSGVAELGMMVRDGHRGAGIGSALMQACIGWCREVRAHKLTLQMWPHNETALALYRKFGFAVEGRLVRQWRRRSGELWDAIAMGLALDTAAPGSSHPDAPSL